MPFPPTESVDERVRLALSLFLGFIVSMFDLQLVIRIIVVNFNFTKFYKLKMISSNQVLGET